METNGRRETNGLLDRRTWHDGTPIFAEVAWCFRVLGTRAPTLTLALSLAAYPLVPLARLSEPTPTAPHQKAKPQIPYQFR